MKKLQLTILFFFIPCSFLQASQTIVLTLDRAVEIAMENSYRIKQLKLGIERSRLYLKAEQAGLKSKVYMQVTAPEFEAVSDYKWDSNLSKDVIVRQNTQLWQADLSVRQPLIFFGYPTNGYLSLNNRVYRYDQIDGIRDINYYNRLFLKFEQPLFQPNHLKNDIENAELSLEKNELQFLDDQVDMIEDIADDYYDLFEYAYQNIVYQSQIKELERIEEIANCREKDEKSTLDCIQIQVELNNAREKLAQNKSQMRLEANRLKQRLRLARTDTIVVQPIIKIKEIGIDLEEAISYGESLRPRMRLLSIDKQKQEIHLTNVKGWNAFRMNVAFTYGLEKQDPAVNQLWANDYDNSYSFAVSAYIPIWDWGQRKARIDAQRITIEKTNLSIEQVSNNIRSEITNAVENLKEYQKRALTMQQTKSMSEEITTRTREQYADGSISLQDMLQTVSRQKETEMNFLEAYLGYQNSLLQLMVDTYYDYEKDIKLLDKIRNIEIN